MNAVLEPVQNQAADTYPDGLRAFTFWVEETLYAIDISKVLTISQDLSHIQSVPAKGKGLLGMTEFQDTAIPVVDFAHLLGMKSSTEVGEELIAIFDAREKDHHDWLAALENSIIDGVPFLKAKDPNKCAFGQWYNQFTTNNEELKEMLPAFDEPHKRIHALADQLLDMRVAGESEKALDILRLERDVTMKRLSKHFNHAREIVKGSSRKVLLYISADDTVPLLALQIDNIHDVIDFKPEQFKPMSSLRQILNPDERKIISNFIKVNPNNDCLLVDAVKILDIIEQ